MVSKEELEGVIIRVAGQIVDPDDLAEAIAAEVAKLVESRESKETRVVRATEIR